MNGCAHAAFAHQLAAPGGDRRDYVLDLTGLIARSRHFAPLMNDADRFAKVDIVLVAAARQHADFPAWRTT